MTTLNISENFILLTQHPSKGKFLINDIYMDYGLTGAILLDLSLSKSIVLENKKLSLVKEYTGKNPLVAEISKMIQYAKKNRKIKYWINKLVKKTRKNKWLIIKDLSEKQILRIVNKKFLGLIPYKRSFLIDSSRRMQLIQELQNALSDNTQLTNDKLALLSLIEACKMYKIFNADRKKMKELKVKLKRIIKECPVADNLNESVLSIQTAIISALITTTVAATFSSRS